MDTTTALLGAGGVLLGIGAMRTILRLGKAGVRIVAPGVDYAVTNDDLLWLGRATQCESRSAPREHAWCMIQRFVAQRQIGGEWTTWSTTLRKSVQSFSSPVNPRWLPGGDKYREHPDWRAAGPAAQSLRRQCMVLKAEDFRPEVQEVLAEIKAGVSENPIPGLTNFAACWTEAARGGIPYGGNCFIVDPPVRGPVRLV